MQLHTISHGVFSHIHTIIYLFLNNTSNITFWRQLLKFSTLAITVLA